MAKSKDKGKDGKRTKAKASKKPGPRRTDAAKQRSDTYFENRSPGGPAPKTE